jgi:NADPH:quinone reductase-like Zn-dependent oxidoreductase
MKAMVYKEYGSPDYLRLKEIEVPAVKENEVLVKVHASSVNWIDWHFLMGKPFMVRIMAGLFKPKNNVLGIDLAGHVEAVGKDVKGFQPGDEVFGTTGHGCFSEFVCVPAEGVIAKPASLTFEEAAAVPGAATPALQALRDLGKIQPKQEVLINGASGGVGTFAVQIAKSFGAEVTGVCSARNLAMARSLGADHVIDYAREDFTQNGQRYDLIIGVNGYHSILDYRRALAPRGRYVAIGGSKSQVIQGILMGPVLSTIGSKKMGFMGIARPNQEDLVTVKELVEAGKVAPVIDRSYPLAEAAEAMGYLAEGHAQGKVVITVDPDHRGWQSRRRSQVGGNS